MRGRFGFIGLVFLGVFALIVGSIAYNWGLATGTAQVVPPGTVVYPIAYGHPFGFGFGGFLVLLLVVGLIVGSFRARRWAGGSGGWGHGGPGPGRWGGHVDPNDPRVRAWMDHDVPPPFQSMLETWHRRAHGEPGGGDAPGSANAPATPAGNGGAAGPRGASGAGDHPSAGI